jgi:hypothetical protein
VRDLVGQFIVAKEHDVSFECTATKALIIGDVYYTSTHNGGNAWNFSALIG